MMLTACYFNHRNRLIFQKTYISWKFILLKYRDGAMNYVTQQCSHESNETLASKSREQVAASLLVFLSEMINLGIVCVHVCLCHCFRPWQRVARGWDSWEKQTLASAFWWTVSKLQQGRQTLGRGCFLHRGKPEFQSRKKTGGLEGGRFKRRGIWRNWNVHLGSCP